MDEAEIRTALRDVADEGGEPVVNPDQVGQVLVDGDWACVVLASEAGSRQHLDRIYRHLRSSFPGGQFEIRAGNRIHRGGAGLGEGRHLIAVLGGKGGVGKSTLAVNLALTLTAMGMKVGLIDADLNAPDIAHMVGAHPRMAPGGGWRNTNMSPRPPDAGRSPVPWYGMEVMSAGFVVPEGFPPMITSRGLVSTLLNDLVFGTAWNADVLLLDAPPGTGEELQVMTRELPLSGAIFITTPQDLAQMDAERTLALLEERGVPVIGLVFNMAGLTCPHCSQEIDLFAQSNRLTGAGMRAIGRIPFDVQLSVAADQGRPLVLGQPRGPVAFEFARIGAAVRRWLGERETVVLR